MYSDIFDPNEVKKKVGVDKEKNNENVNQLHCSKPNCYINESVNGCICIPVRECVVWLAF